MTGCWVSLGRLSAEWVSEGGVATSDSWGSVPRRRGDRASRLGFRNGKRSRGNGDSRVANSSVRGLPQAHSRQLRELHADYVSLRVATDAWLGQRRSQVRRVALPELLEQVHARVATVCRLTRCLAAWGREMRRSAEFVRTAASQRGPPGAPSTLGTETGGISPDPAFRRAPKCFCRAGALATTSLADLSTRCGTASTWTSSTSSS